MASDSLCVMVHITLFAIELNYHTYHHWQSWIHQDLTCSTIVNHCKTSCVIVHSRFINQEVSLIAIPYFLIKHYQAPLAIISH